MVHKANFTAGPALLPVEVEEKLRRATFDFGGTGLPIWSISHRSSAIEQMCGESIELVKELLNVPKGYSVLFVSGGATTELKSWIVNISGGRVKAIGYIDSGHWGNEAIKAARELEAHNFCSVRILASSAKDKYRFIPYLANDECHECDFVHFTTNETANGTQLAFELSPQYGGGTWVADMTSDIFSRPFPVSCFGLVYAGAQKNLGIAGATIVIVRDSLIEDGHKALPAPLSYAEQKKWKGALRNTPDTLALCGVYYTLQWIKGHGGVTGMQNRSRERASALYSAIDGSSMFEGICADYARSTMNVLFRLRDQGRHDAFLRLCERHGIVGIKGHSGSDKHYGPHLRASLYNGQTMENVNLLVDLIQVFDRRN